MYYSICHLASTCFSLTQQPQPYLRLSDWWLSCCLKRFARQVAAEAPWVSTLRGGGVRGGGRAHPCHTRWGGFIFGECHSEGTERSHGQEVGWQHKRLSYTSGAYAVLSITSDSLQASVPFLRASERRGLRQRIIRLCQGSDVKPNMWYSRLTCTHALSNSLSNHNTSHWTLLTSTSNLTRMTGCTVSKRLI